MEEEQPLEAEEVILALRQELSDALWSVTVLKLQLARAKTASIAAFPDGR